MGVNARRKVRPPKPVLVRAGGIWTGRLYEWERRLDGWYGHAIWTADFVERRGMLAAKDLRPFEQRWVEVRDPFGLWCPGQLVGWRRRPGGYPWEGWVKVWQTADRPGPPDWYKIGDIRITVRPPGFIEGDAF